jgi:hypothetical protein
MHVRVSTFAPATLVLAIAAAACEDGNSVLRTGPTRPAPLQSQLLSVEPALLTPEFLPGPSCRGFAPFQLRFNLVLRADRQFGLERIRFGFRDRSGGRTVPIVVPSVLPDPGGRALPITIPTTPAVPVPGALPVHGTTVSPPFGTLGLLVSLGCGVPPVGTLLIDADTIDPDGRSDTARVSATVG